MIRIRLLQSRGPGSGRTQRITIVWRDTQEVTASADEVRRTALALLRVAERSEVRTRLLLQGMPHEQVSKALGDVAEGAEGEFQVRLGPRPDTVRLTRGDTGMLLATEYARTMGHDWLRVAESADADHRLVRALEQATALTPEQIDDVFAYLRLLRCQDPATEITDN